MPCPTKTAARSAGRRWPPMRRKGFVPAACSGGRWSRKAWPPRAEKGTVPICAKHPEGRSGKWGLSPFPSLARRPRPPN